MSMVERDQGTSAVVHRRPHASPSEMSLDAIGIERKRDVKGTSRRLQMAQRGEGTPKYCRDLGILRHSSYRPTQQVHGDRWMSGLDRCTRGRAQVFGALGHERVW